MTKIRHITTLQAIVRVQTEFTAWQLKSNLVKCHWQ